MQKVIETPASTTAKKLTAEIVTITPGMAQAWLDKNVNNRRLRPNVVNAYMRAMLDGNWTLSGDAIRFDQAGNLMDGQHRLNACVDAGVSFQSMVLYNVPEAARHTIDTNISRSPADVLVMSGGKNATQVVATVRWLVMAKLGHGTARMPGTYQRLKITTQEVMTVLDNHPMLATCVARIMNASPRIRGTTPAALAWITYVAETYLDKAQEAATFVDVFRTGIPSRNGCAAHAFRERALRGGAGRDPLSFEFMQLGVVHAWNLHVGGAERNAHFRIPQTVWITGLDRKKIK